MQSNNNAVVAALLVLLLSGCAYSRQSAMPFTISGTVTDAEGRPLEDVEVSVNIDFIKGYTKVTTGADGRYVFKGLPNAKYRVNALVKARYAGGTVCQALANQNLTDAHAVPTSDGAVRNFRWQLTGKAPTVDSYFGVPLHIWDLESALVDARSVIFTLRPIGRLIDGSRAKAIVREAILGSVAGFDGLFDLPLGTYRMKAVMVDKDGRRFPLTLAPVGSLAFRPEIALVWQPDPVCGPYTDGVDAFTVTFQRK